MVYLWHKEGDDFDRFVDVPNTNWKQPSRCSRASAVDHRAVGTAGIQRRLKTSD